MAIRDTARRKLTYEDYLLFPDDGDRHEILDGEHSVTPAPVPKHQRVSMNLSLGLGPFIRQHNLGDLLAAPIDVVLSDNDLVQPDLLFISRRRAAIITDKNIQGAPDLAIEIISDPTRLRDEHLKRRRYDELGAQEYWLVDRFHGTVRVFRRNGGRFESIAELSVQANDVLTTPLLPGLRLPLAEIFA